MSEEKTHSTLRWVALALSAAAAIWLIYAGVRHELAGHYGASSDPDDMLRASQIEPANAEYWYHLGRFRQLDFDHADIPLAISYYRRAVQLDPWSPYYKLGLAASLEMAGDNAEADKYFRGAQEDYPISPEVAWRYGNFLLRQQRGPDAYSQIHRAVTGNPKLTSLAISRAWHSDPNVSILLDQVLPDTAPADWEAIAFFSDAQEPSAGMAVWKRLITKKPQIIWKQLYPFIDMLVTQEKYDDARLVWRQATSLTSDSPAMQSNSSVVFDGGFEKDISGGGFGWQQTDVAGADFDFDTDIKHSGARSARIIFDGTQNLNYTQLFQRVLVSPGTHYHFSGYLQTNQIATESGIRFEIFDPKDPKNLDVFTPNETGTQPWNIQEADFTVGPQTRLIQIRVFRGPSQHFDNKIRGTVWIDDVEIVPVGVNP